MAIKRVILIRPGETAWNREGRWQGWVASPLSDYGRAQALALGRYVRNIGMSALYSSDLKRAVETATILASQLEFEPIFDERWRERSIGHWQGMTLEEIRNWCAADYQKLQADVENYQMPGGESRSVVKKRVLAAFNAVLADDKGSTVGIITHTSSTHALLQSLVTNYDLYTSVLGNTSVTTIALNDEGQWEIVASNDVSHLEGLTSRSVSELEA